MIPESESNLVNHARRELALIPTDPDDDIQPMINEHLIKMVELFADEGHSGFSAGYAINALTKLLRFEPLAPLTGDDGEWVEVSDGCFQNNRCPRIFKDETGAYDIDGKVFIEPDGCSFTSRDSRVYVSFPYRPKTEYVQVERDDGAGQ